MKRVLVVAVVAAVTLLSGLVMTADAKTLRGAKNTWMTKSIRDRIEAAGSQGIKTATVHRWARKKGTLAPDEQPTEHCPGSDPSNADVYAGACEVYPFQCTMNFIYKIGPGEAAAESDGRNYFIGTAGHCVEHVGQPLFIENNGTYVYVGDVARTLKGGGNTETGQGEGGFGNDFSAVKIDAGHTIDPSLPVVGGPQGIYTGCDPQMISWYGHGFGVAVGQGQPGGGLAHLWFDRDYAWDGDGLPGDSGSGVVTQDGEAAGNLTHLVINSKYPAATNLGTRLTRILTFLGGNFYLVNEDYSTSRATMADTACGNANNGGGAGTAVSTLLG